MIIVIHYVQNEYVHVWYNTGWVVGSKEFVYVVIMSKASEDLCN